MLTDRLSRSVPPGQRPSLAVQFVSFGFVFVALAFLYKLGPGLLPSAGMQQFFLGLAKCYAGDLPALRCDSIAHPEGYKIAFGLPYVLPVAVLERVGLPLILAGKLVALAFLMVALVGATELSRNLGMRFFIALSIAALFLMSPIVYAQDGYGPLRLGFALLPLYVWTDQRIVQRLASVDERRALIAVFFTSVVMLSLVRTFALFMDGYSFVMALALSGALILARSIGYLASREYRRALMLLGVFCISVLVAYLLYRAYVGASVENTVMPIDFFRGQGVDLYALLVPSAMHWWAEMSGLHHQLNGWLTYSDGPNVAFVYLGISLVPFLLLAAVLVFRRAVDITQKQNLITLSLVFLFGFLLALGPSLKLADFRDEPPPPRSIQFSDYLMPESAATLSLRTDWLYQEVPGIRNMRAVYRWMLLVKLAILLIAGLVLEHLSRSGSGKVWVIPLMILMLIDLAPNFPQQSGSGKKNLVQFRSFEADALSSFVRLGLQGKRVLLVPASTNADWNHFTANYLCPLSGAKCFNLGGDKSLMQARLSWPNAIREISRGRWVEGNLASIAGGDHVDELLIPLFSLREAAYRWPPSPHQVKMQLEQAERLARSAGLAGERSGWFYRLAPHSGHPSSREAKSEASDLNIVRWGPKAGSFAEGFNVQHDGRSAFWVLFNEEQPPEQAYVLLLGSLELETFNAGAVLSGRLISPSDAERLSPGSYSLKILDRATGSVSEVGTFELLESDVVGR